MVTTKYYKISVVDIFSILGGRLSTVLIEPQHINKWHTRNSLACTKKLEVLAVDLALGIVREPFLIHMVIFGLNAKKQHVVCYRFYVLFCCF